jgi:D-glycerate 3-kinase
MSDPIAALIEAERLPEDYREAVNRFWRPLAEAIAVRVVAKRPLLVGINGGQGSGKTTLCRFLEVLLAERGLTTVTLALDDFYLPRSERARMATDHHPLFATRGVPGTHDTSLAMRVLDRLLDGESAELPVFDKASDDRSERTRYVDGPVDVVLFEGWCVGAAPQSAAALREPINDLERMEDADGVWRREVNRRLATDYAELFARIDLLVMLEVPDFAAVRANRLLQERKLGAGPAVMDKAALDRFVAHYQRLTEQMFAEMPHRADILIEIGCDQSPTRLSTGAQSV